MNGSFQIKRGLILANFADSFRPFLSYPLGYVFQILRGPVAMRAAHCVQKHVLEGLNVATELRRFDAFKLDDLAIPNEHDRRTSLGIIKELVESRVSFAQRNSFHTRSVEPNVLELNINLGRNQPSQGAHRGPIEERNNL